MKTTFVSAVGLFILLLSSCAQSFVGRGKAVDPFQYNIVKSNNYDNGSVVSAHPLASQVGAQILKKGGNAFDAAIATQLALAVVYPGAGNIGGGGFLVGRLTQGQTFTLDYRETAPATAHRDMYLDEKGNAQTHLAQDGHLAAGVPGTVAGLFATMQYAKLPFKVLIQPAIDLAQNGFSITEREANSLNNYREDFRKYNTIVPVFVKDNWKAGDVLVQTDLANTLKRIRDKGAAGFYEGETANLVVAEMKRGKGMITLADLKNYQPKMRQPLVFDYKGYTIITMPPPSSGGILIWQMLKMVEQRPLKSYGFQTAKSVQLMTEAERRAYADRAEHLGDPDFWKVPVQTLVSEPYLQARMRNYDSTRAGTSTGIQPGKVESEETTHISIMDAAGNMAAVTTTLNGGYGSRTVVGGAGFLLNNEMDDFSIKPGVANMYGAVGGEANAIAPGKRMLSSMTPTLLLQGEKPFMVVGTPGGTTIPTSVYQTIINVVDFNMTAYDAINTPRFHHQWLPDEVVVEKDFPANVRQQLTAMGYKLVEKAIGRVELIKINNGKLEAAADKRGDDSVAGY